MADQTYFEGVGRRKTSTARVRVYPGGSGVVTVNDKPLEVFFPRIGDADMTMKPLNVVGLRSKMDVTVKVRGGGVTGQVGSVVLGLSRALLKYDETLRPQLRKAGFLTRDARAKERKKPGLKRARKAPTYTKR
ncbi:MAG: 30S ribosomal protein S9 [Chloroflexi bacterium]|nr:30S ribosomal protein S9 [Chloroflexota bacterium]